MQTLVVEVEDQWVERAMQLLEGLPASSIRLQKCEKPSLKEAVRRVMEADGREHMQIVEAFGPSEKGRVSDVLKLLATDRFTHRPAADPKEVQDRIEGLRNEWGD